MVSADSLGKNKFYGAIDYLKKQIDRPEYDEMYGFRFNLVRSFAQMEHPDAVDFLCQLRRTLDGQLRFQIENVLKDVTVASSKQIPVVHMSPSKLMRQRLAHGFQQQRVEIQQ